MHSCLAKKTIFKILILLEIIKFPIMKHKLLLFSFIILSCGVEESEDNLINNDQFSVSDNSSTENSTANNASSNNSQQSESSTYLGTNCKEVSYSSKPDPDYVNGDYSY